MSALMVNLLPQANTVLASGTQGVYVEKSMPPVPSKLAAKIQWGAYVDIEELLPEFWAPAREENQPMQEAKAQWACSVQDIFAWLQCYRMFVSVLAPLHPTRNPELMAYQATIVRASQHYAGLAWVRYNSAFHR